MRRPARLTMTGGLSVPHHYGITTFPEIAISELERYPRGELNAALAREVVRVHRRCAGRGPTRAKAFYRDDVVVVLLEDALTKGERSLVDGGRRDAALTLRRQLQTAMRAELMTAVADVTARRVVACLTDTDVERDLTAEVFILDGTPDAAR